MNNGNRSHEFVQITTTTETADQSRQIASRLIELHFAACVQIEGPIESRYRWEGKVHCDSEWRLSIKTTAARYADVEAVILQMHAYDQPQIIANPIVAGSAGYLQWLIDQTAP